jgi:predicted ester cyclase
VGTAENKAVQWRIIEEVINRNNPDTADELFSEEHELHPEAAGVGRGPEGMKRAFAGLHEEFPDVRVEIESLVAEGDMVAVRLTFSGTHAFHWRTRHMAGDGLRALLRGQGRGELGAHRYRAQPG